MNRHFSRSLVLVHFILSAVCLFPAQAPGEEKGLKDIRPSALAGTWYPGTRDALAKTIQGFLARAETPHLDGVLKALIVPHAGHRYSGGVAAHSYHLLKKRQFKRIILVGPSHRMGFKGVSVNLQSGYETPLGVVSVDREVARKILNAEPFIRWIKKAHALEHSLEIQLPFLQTVLQNFQIVPILMGEQDFDTCSGLANSLVKVLGSAEDTLLVASSDLSHYYPYSQAKALDLQFIKRIRKLDHQGLVRDLSVGKCEACGAGPVISTLLAAQQMGANQGLILNYANSGDVTGDHSRVVGYLAAALLRGN